MDTLHHFTEVWLCDFEFCAQDGTVEAIVVPGPFNVGHILKGERTGIVIPWSLIQKIGDDVILVCLPEGALV